MNDERLERELRAALRTDEPGAVPEELRRRVATVPDTVGPGRTAPPRGRLVWAMPALVVVVVMALVAVWLPGGLFGPTGPSASPTSPRSPGPTSSDISWTKVATTSDLINSVIALPSGGYLAVGSVGDVQGVLWSSPDGRSWQRSEPTDPALANSLFDDVVALPHGGFLMVGNAAALDALCGGGALGCNPVQALRMWTSRDGRAWQPLPAATLAVFGRVANVNVAVGPTGLVASGLDYPATGDPKSGVWTSPDGTTWSLAPQFARAFPTAGMDAIAALQHGFVATGNLHFIGSSQPDGAAWFSADGTTWTPAAIPASRDEVPGLHTSAGGALAYRGGTGIPTPFWWTADGRVWQTQTAASVPFALAPTPVAFLSDGDRIVALGQASDGSGAAGAWTSTDARSWRTLTETNPPPLGAFDTGTFGPTGIVVFVGSDIWFGGWTPPTPSAIPAPRSPAVSPTSSLAQVTATWTSVTLPTVPGQSSVAVGGPFTGGLVAIPGGGFIDFVPTADEGTAVLRSEDGTRWTQIGSVSGPDATGIGGPLAFDGHTYVALGGEPGGGYYGEQTNGAAWVSTDLRHWTKAPDQAAFGGVESWNGIAARPSGFVAIGYAEGGRTVWTSPDGLHWTLLIDDAAFPAEAAEPRAIATTSDGFLVVGRVGQQAAAWTSPDGHDWTVHGPYAGGTGVVLDGLAHGTAGWVSLGWGPNPEVPPTNYETPVAGWTSGDSVTWQAGPPSPALLGLDGAVVAVPGGFVAAGTVGLGVGVFLSMNGLVWTPASGLDQTTANVVMLASDGRHVLVETTGPAGSGIWVSSGVTP